MGRSTSLSCNSSSLRPWWQTSTEFCWFQIFVFFFFKPNQTVNAKREEWWIQHITLPMMPNAPSCLGRENQINWTCVCMQKSKWWSCVLFWRFIYRRCSPFCSCEMFTCSRILLSILLVPPWPHLFQPYKRIKSLLNITNEAGITSQHNTTQISSTSAEIWKPAAAHHKFHGTKPLSPPTVKTPTKRLYLCSASGS